MNMQTICQRCDAELTAQAVGGLCASCLLKLALEPPHDEVSVTNPPSSADHYFGDYQLLEMIGRGGMGVVYKARQKHLNRTVALKMVQNWRDASLDTLARFQIEARAAAKLDHPNIVPTYQIGELNGQPFFSMKLVAGMSLSKKSRELVLVKPRNDGDAKPSSRSSREAQVPIANLLAKVARAVHYAHQQGVIHRDLKPSNILIDTAGEPHLTDFGVAKLVEQDCGLTRTHEMLGTPAYMAPEQAAGKAISPAVDIYSLGAILYELLTGQPPFRGKSPLETLRKAAEEEPVPPSTMNGSIDVELAAICLKCLEKKPMHRYGSALSVAEDLERWMRREPILAKRTGPFGRTIRWTRRNPVGASLIGTLSLGLVGVLLLLGWVYGVNEKIAAMLQEVERSQRGEARKTVLLVSIIREELEKLWDNKDRKVLRISSEQLAVLSALPILDFPKGVRPERLRFGLSANENPLADSYRYTELLSHLEQRLSKRRGHPVRIDLYFYKYKEDRTQAIVEGQLDLARMGTVYYLQTKQQHPGIQALVEMESAAKTAVFFTRTNSGIESLADLKGRRMAFGDPASSVTFWGQAKMAQAGLAGRELSHYTFFDSRTEFIEEVHALGLAAVTNRIKWLHSTVDVIEEVLAGRFDAGVTTERGFAKHQSRGLVRIPGSEFDRRPSPWVARPNLPADLTRDIVEIMTSLRDESFMQTLPDSPTGFKRITEDSHAPERDAMRKIEELFPIK